jgi:ATP-binding cassette subfamily C (CFTR/MRP) protein 4
MLSESISGVSTIRPNDATQYMRRKFEIFHNSHSRAFFGFVAASRWVGFRMDSLMFMAVSCSCVLAAIFSDRGWFEVDPVIFGLALSMLIQLGAMFQWTIRQSAEVVNQMICVERVSEYSKVESEADLSKVSDQKLVNWPKSGDIEVNNLSIRYRSTLPLSLSGISFSIKSGQKVGVVGRTGSGKSTLVQALFRILEAETGSITIDGVDISTLGLHKLRMGMSVISQYPVLFSGCTVRENLDPFEQYSDDAIKEALDDVQMVNAIDNLPDGLQYRVAEGGSNFSVGERQLLCLARATLQKSRILVLDEPTANIDIRTDQLLQEAVKKSFPGGTIVSVAHRLDTIIDNDVVLVLGAGKVLEFDSPHNLIEKNGHFAKMVNDTGAEMSDELRRRALANSK